MAKFLVPNLSLEGTFVVHLQSIRHADFGMLELVNALVCLKDIATKFWTLTLIQLEPV